MDLGIKGRNAIICASSRGLGKACAKSLVLEGVNVVINGRNDETLTATIEDLKSLDCASVTGIVADLDTEAGKLALIEACPQADILVNNNGGPPPGAFLDWGEDDWQKALTANLLTPLFMIKSLLPGMRERKFGRIVNITSAMVKSPHSAMGLSTTARTGLTAMSKALSKDVACDNVTINNILPERIDTDRQKQMAQLAMKFKNITLEEARAEIAASIAANRLGDPKEFGDACAFLCSAQAGFISGQNLQLDGGSYDGLI